MSLRDCPNLEIFDAKKQKIVVEENQEGRLMMFVRENAIFAA